MTDDLTDIIGSLRAKRADHLKSVDVLDEAIEALTRLVGRPVKAVDRTVQTVNRSTSRHGSDGEAPRTPKRPTTTKSVPGACLMLAREQPRDWSAEEVVREYMNRGTPLEVADPMNSVFSALSRLSRKGQLVRTAPGRYVASEFADQIDTVGRDPHERFADNNRFALVEEEMRGGS